MIRAELIFKRRELQRQMEALKQKAEAIGLATGKNKTHLLKKTSGRRASTEKDEPRLQPSAQIPVDQGKAQRK
jgi:hypothetical protein